MFMNATRSSSKDKRQRQIRKIEPLLYNHTPVKIKPPTPGYAHADAKKEKSNHTTIRNDQSNSDHLSYGSRSGPVHFSPYGFVRSPRKKPSCAFCITSNQEFGWGCLSHCFHVRFQDSYRIMLSIRDQTNLVVNMIAPSTPKEVLQCAVVRWVFVLFQ